MASKSKEINVLKESSRIIPSNARPKTETKFPKIDSLNRL